MIEGRRFATEIIDEIGKAALDEEELEAALRWLQTLQDDAGRTLPMYPTIPVYSTTWKE